MTKLGMSISLINRLQEDNLLQHLAIDENGNLSATPEFEEHKANMNDMYRFEVNRFLG
jgi:ABC-type thiamine transport system ATPase subunit